MKEELVERVPVLRDAGSFREARRILREAGGFHMARYGEGWPLRSKGGETLGLSHLVAWKISVKIQHL